MYSTLHIKIWLVPHREQCVSDNTTNFCTLFIGKELIFLKASYLTLLCAKCRAFTLKPAGTYVYYRTQSFKTVFANQFSAERREGFREKS